ncbi:molybdopterin-binding oxidoreductase [Aeromonas caviae]|uniref:molybdopterin-binding oxidoreductase n=1 Tax=Aeromonas caviae TaxID=648 RepID=UPI0013E29AB1|nr:molybdopterin-binding oxidoreductase [Aeromonas caviae]MDK3163309.1 molybdopterin-binding oxidoreductase [Aeromonas caviae]MEA9440418.1 molybdopterin-binding oxidoreductase [Aeromonas caviae]
MRYLGLLPLLLSLALPGMAQAAPQGPVILKVTGNLDPADPADGEVLFDMAMIQALPQHEVVTSNPWVDKPHKYVGPKLADVLTEVKANGKSITLTALNSFQIRINWDKVKQYDPILAWQDDGMTMRVRDMGPLWFILPLDQHPELRRSEFTDMMIWQLSAIDIQQ